MDDEDEAFITMDAVKVVSVAPERNVTEKTLGPDWDFDAEIFVIWITGGVVFATLLGMIICLLATRKKSRSSTATIRASSFNFHRPRIDEVAPPVYRPRGGENPAYSVTNEDVNEWFGSRTPRILNSLARPSDSAFLADNCNQARRQQLNASNQARASRCENDPHQMVLPPLNVPETGQTYQSGPPPPSPPPPLQQQLQQCQTNNSSHDNQPTYIMENGEFILDPYFLASAPPPYTPPYGENHPVNIHSVDRSLTLPIRNNSSMRRSNYI